MSHFTLTLKPSPSGVFVIVNPFSASPVTSVEKPSSLSSVTLYSICLPSFVEGTPLKV